MTAFGQPEPVTFHAGFFSDSVPRWTRKSVACLWMDVDLEQSAADALAVPTSIREAPCSHTSASPRLRSRTSSGPSGPR